MNAPHRVFAFGSALLLVLTGCGGDEAVETDLAPVDSSRVAPANTVITAAREAGLSTFETAVVQADLDDRLHGEGPFTVFGPTNAAFERLGDPRLDTLLADRNRGVLGELVLYHAVAGRLETNSIDGLMTFETLHGGPITLERTAEGVFVSDASGTRARVVTPDLNRGNGVLHVIDAVLTPAPAADTTGQAQAE
jgi:uncharacterized surface protein with fasciclin (FAS1) repeats